MTCRKHYEITLTPLEQRYISTCYPLPDRPFIDEVHEWQERLRISSTKGESIVAVVADIGRVFPHVGRLCREGFFDERSIQSYFEGIDPLSHTMRMYLFGKRVARKQPPEHILLAVLHHIEHCSVRVADLNTSTVWSYGMTYQYPLDIHYFNLNARSSRVLVHGKSNKGVIVVRDASEEEFEKFSSWYEERQSSNTNPFVRCRDRLETLL